MCMCNVQEKRMTEEEMAEWHHRFNGHDFEQAPGDGKGQGSPVCCIHGAARSWNN